jgi:hypothetical protein
VLFDLSTLASCTELTVEHAKQAASSSSELRALLKRVAEIARPGEDCPKILIALARLVGQDWVEGELRVELSGDDESTTLIVLCEHGIGIRERMFPRVRFRVPLDEFERALKREPQLVLPLMITDEAGKLVLTPLLTPEECIYGEARPEFELDQASLGEGHRTTRPPPPDELQIVDEALPEDPNESSVHDVKAVLPSRGASAAGEHDLARRMNSGGARSEKTPDPRNERDRTSNIHTRPTVRRMVAVDAAAIAAVQRRDPRREED